jgi:hypothetical protein
MTNNIPQKAVGHIITWQSPTSVAIAALRAGLALAGIDPKLARDLSDYSKLARTARGLSKSDSATKRIARPVEGKRARQLTREHAENGGLRYDREAMLALNENGRLVVDAPEIEAAARAAFDSAQERRSASDVTRLIKRIVESAGSDLMPLRDQGGVYFVPSGHAVVAQLETLLGHVGGSLRKFAVTIGDGSEQSIAAVVADYLSSEIAALRESVAELDSDARADVKARRMERLAELRAKLAAYSTLLAASAGTVQSALDSADAAIVAKLTGNAAV